MGLSCKISLKPIHWCYHYPFTIWSGITMGSPWDWEDGPPMMRRMTRPVWWMQRNSESEFPSLNQRQNHVNLVGQESIMIYLILFDDELKNSPTTTGVYWWYFFDDEVDIFYHQLLVTSVLLIQEFPQFHGAGSDDSHALHADSHALHALPALPEPPEAPQDEAGASDGGRWCWIDP